MAESEEGTVQWLQAARAGSNDALGRALDGCRRYLLAVAQKGLGPDLLAKGGASDVVQETFLEAQRDFARFHGGTEEELLAWLRQLLLHNLGDFTRRYRRTGMRAVAREVNIGPQESGNNAVPGLAAPTPTPSVQVMAQEQAVALQQALARLPDEYRQVISWRYQENCPFEEIGRRLDRSAEAARKLWARAMERLRQEWAGPL